jgi:hypothetical protein
MDGLEEIVVTVVRDQRSAANYRPPDKSGISSARRTT